MKESVTYQAIVEEGVVKGRLEEARRILYGLGEQLFGALPGSRVQRRIESVNSLEVLEGLTVRVLRVQTWEELLAAYRPPRLGRAGDGSRDG